MSEETWRPLGVETEDEIAQYDALHDGVPDWMSAAFWAWVRSAVTVIRPTSYGDWRHGQGRAAMLDTDLAEHMCQRLRISFSNLRSQLVSQSTGENQLTKAVNVLSKHSNPLEIADYLLAHGGHAKAEDLNDLLERSKSAWVVEPDRAGQGLFDASHLAYRSQPTP